MTAQAIGIFASIIKWSESLQPWEREAVRRLVVNGSLGKTDEDDIIKLIKEPPTTEIITPEIPDPQPSVAESVYLVSLKHLKGVNALAPGCTLTYGGPVGLTVIYGDNGSGKSGYARILKKACRSRHPEPPILPNVFGSKSPVLAAEAEFVYMAGGGAITEPWIEGTSSSEELASIAVFDSKSARLYVEKEGELAYRPYGLEVFDQLGEFYRSAKRRLLEEAASILVPKCITVFDHAKVRDAVAAVLGDNSEKNQKAINALGTMADDEKTEAAQLQAQILQLENEDPKKLAASRRTIANKLLETAQRITTAHSKIQNDAKLLRESMEKAASESYLAKQASLIAFSKEPISGVGSDQWKAMFEDARAFSTEVAYPGQTFPVVGENSRCLLCHQTLDNDAKDRLSRFADYIGNKAEERARLATKTYEQQRKEILEAVKGITGLDDALIDQVSEWNDAVGQAIKATRKDFSIWLTSAEAVSSSEQWTMLAVPAADTNAMAALAERLKAEADELEKNAKPEALLKLKDRQSLLNDQISLSKALPTIIEIAGCEAKKRWLQKLSNAISTSHISRQATATTEQVLTKALCNALNTELEALDATSLKVEFAKKGDVGSVLHYLKLSNAPKGTKIEDVLSEGEHRCLAIAAFLAELVQLGHASAVVFDDPVSSLDHKRRDRVAARLVEEAKRRQVVIFSHDLAFIYALDQAAAQTQTPMRTHAVKRTTAGTGDLVDGLYPEAMGLKDLISHIRLQATELSHLDELDAGRRAKVVDCYDLIRAAWERVVEASLLRSVVSPFDKAVHTQKLNSVLVEDTDYQTVYWAMKKASDIVEAHRTAPAGGTTNIPKNGQLLADIEALETFRRDTERRATDVAARRKKLESPPSC